MSRLTAEAEAPSTRSQRDALETRWRAWCRRQGVKDDSASIPLFVMAMRDLKSSSALHYLSALKARSQPAGPLQLAMKALRKRMAREDISQAPPLLPAMVLGIFHRLWRQHTPAAVAKPRYR